MRASPRVFIPCFWVDRCGFFEGQQQHVVMQCAARAWATAWGGRFNTYHHDVPLQRFFSRLTLCVPLLLSAMRHVSTEADLWMRGDNTTNLMAVLREGFQVGPQEMQNRRCLRRAFVAPLLISKRLGHVAKCKGKRRREKIGTESGSALAPVLLCGVGRIIRTRHIFSAYFGHPPLVVCWRLLCAFC